MKAYRVIAISLGVILVLAALLRVWGLSEGYCYLWPSIDTEYAEGYSEEDFGTIRVGMTMSEVQGIMCPPLSVYPYKSGLVQVWYTSDGAAPFGDFAWFGRGLEVRKGVVIRVVKQIYYD